MLSEITERQDMSVIEIFSMPRARIISRSSDCCRELALELLARGYAVEIVSPDKIPDNFADLELRVDPPVVNSVRPCIAAQDGAHSASHDFVGHLREPMPAFIRRPPTMDELIASGIAARAERKLTSQIKPPIPVSSHKPPAEEARSLLPNPQLEECLIATPERVTNAMQTRERFRRRIMIKFRLAHLKQMQIRPWITVKALIGSNPWFLRTFAGLVAVGAMGALLVIGVRGVGPLVQNGPADSKKNDAKAVPLPAIEWHATSAPEIKNTTSASQGSMEASAQSVRLPKVKSADAKPQMDTSVARDLQPEKPAVYRGESTSKSVAATRPGKVRNPDGDDAIAKDTVTYFDKGIAHRNHVP
jgi:hypothetical protein